MDEITRRAVAYIIGCLNEKNHNSYIYDYNSSKYFSFSFSGTSVYDYSNSYFLTISRNGTSSYNIFSYLNRGYITLNIKGNSFDGYDYNSNSHFSGTINNKQIDIFDFQKGRYFHFSV